MAEADFQNIFGSQIAEGEIGAEWRTKYKKLFKEPATQKQDVGSVATVAKMPVKRSRLANVSMFLKDPTSDDTVRDKKLAVVSDKKQSLKILDV